MRCELECSSQSRLGSRRVTAPGAGTAEIQPEHEILGCESGRDLVLTERLFDVNRIKTFFKLDRGRPMRMRIIGRELDQVTTSLTTRLSYTFTPNLSLQLYAEPFISAGDYEGFMIFGRRAARRPDHARPGWHRLQHRLRFGRA